MNHQRDLLLSLMARYGLILFAVIVLGNCTSKKPNAPVVAVYDGISITLADFERVYFSQWQITEEPDNPSLRLKIVKEIIEQELIARDPALAGWDSLPEVRRKTQRDYERSLRRRFWEREIGDSITLPAAEELNRQLRLQNTRLYVRQIYSPDSMTIANLAQSIKQGATFNQIYSSKDSIRHQPYGQLLGWLGWGDTDWPVEQTLYELSMNEPSQAVQSLMGWHIFWIDSIQATSVIVSPHPLEIKKLAYKVRERHFDWAVAQYTRDHLWQLKLRVDMAALHQLWGYIQPLLPRDQRERAMISLENLPEKIPVEIRAKSIASIEGKPFSAEQLIKALPDIHHSYWKLNLRQALELALRDSIITNQARESGMEEDPVVLEKKHRYQIINTWLARLSQRMYMYNETQELAHRALLPKEYSQKNILIDTALLRSAFNDSTIIF